MRRPEQLAGVDGVDLSGRTVLVTGATHGIGRHVARSLSRLGATVLVHGRDREAGGSLVDAMGGGTFLPADFADMGAVRDLARAVEERVDGLDVLVNNAGAYFRRGERTADGVEQTMAVNHLAPFLLTDRLLPIVPDGGRIVTVSSDAHRAGELDPEDLRTVGDYDGFEAYARSKLANVLFTRELARRTDRVDANCLHPGLVPGSALWRNAHLPIRAAAAALSVLPAAVVRRVAETPASGARTPVYLAASPDVAGVTGTYFADCEPAEPSAAARDDDLARRLWAESERLLGLDSGGPDERAARGTGTH